MQQTFILHRYSKMSLFSVLLLVILLAGVQSILTLTTKAQIHMAEITAIRPFMNYTRLATASKDQTIIVWNFVTMAPLHVFVESAVVNDVAVNPIDNSIVALLEDGTVKIYDSTAFTLTTSFAFPNSGIGKTISFMNSGTKYMMAGLDTGMVPLLHIYNSTTNVQITSISTAFASGTAVTKIKVFWDVLVAAISDQSSLTYPTQLFSLQYMMLIKMFIDDNAVLNDVGFVIDGSALFTVGSDYSLRNMTQSPYNSLYETTSIKYMTAYGMPHSLEVMIPGLVYVGAGNQIVEYFHIEDYSTQATYSVSNPIKLFLNLYPTLLAASSTGELYVYQISFYDGIDKDPSKWYLLSGVLAGVLVLLSIGMGIQIFLRKLQQKKASKNEQLQAQIKKVPNENQYINTGMEGSYLG